MSPVVRSNDTTMQYNAVEFFVTVSEDNKVP